MKLFALKIAVALVLALELVVAAPYLAMAGDQGQGGQPTNTQEPGQGDPSQTPPTSGDVQERGLSLSPEVRRGSQVLQPRPTAFKCDAATRSCRCFEVEDCNWMRRAVTRCRISDSCTNNCTCNIQ
jgi:hypothetical protein